MGDKPKGASFLKKLDFFSESATLNIGGEAAHRTFYGTLFTVIYTGIMLAIITTQFQSYLDTTLPLAVGESYSTEKYPEVNLTENSLLPVIIAYTNETDFINATDIGRYLTLKAQHTTWKVVKNDKGNDIFEKTVRVFSVKPCRSLSNQKRAILDYMGKDNIFHESIDIHGLCPDIPLDLSVQGKGSDELFTTFDYKIYPCSLGSECKSFNDIIKVNFQMILPNSKLEVNNYTEPLTFTITADDIYFVNPQSHQVFTIKLKQFTVLDYIGLNPSWKERVKIHDIGGVHTKINYRRNSTVCDPAEVEAMDSTICHPYFTFLFQSSGQVIYNKRTYKTLSQTVGVVGGLNSVVIIALLLIYGPINEYRRKEFITKKTYTLLGIKEDDLDKSTAEFGVEVPTCPGQENQGSNSKTEEVENNMGQPPRRTGWMVCCCCRKKTPDQLKWEERVKQAHLKISDSLDVLTIVRNFNLLQVLAHFFLEERHFDLAQYVGFDLWTKEKEERDKKISQEYEDAKVTANKEHRKLKSVRTSSRYLKEKQRFNKWLNFIHDKHANNTSGAGKLRPNLVDEFDEFFFRSLARPESPINLPHHINLYVNSLNSARNLLSNKFGIKDEEAPCNSTAVRTSLNQYYANDQFVMNKGESIAEEKLTNSQNNHNTITNFDTILSPQHGSPPHKQLMLPLEVPTTDGQITTPTAPRKDHDLP